MCENFSASMSTTPSRNLKARKILFVALLALICILLGYAAYEQNKQWVVPEEFKSLKNPLQPTESSLLSARELYSNECAQCHGTRGKGDGPEARSHFPLPADLSDAQRMSAITDGAIFYQISEGRRPMPSFKNRMTQDQRWQLVLLVRSFAQSPATPKN
jgi:mono/diheme cytochrome c family protein